MDINPPNSSINRQRRKQSSVARAILTNGAKSPSYLSMPETPDPVIAATLEYETATLLALEALKGTDRSRQWEACLRFADAVAAIEAMKPEEYNRAGSHLVERGLVPEYAWEEIHAAMEQLAATKGS
jgi:hypothetical protein